MGFQWASALWAQEFFVSTDKGNLGVVGIGDCSFRKILQSTSSTRYFRDITFHPNGKLYGYSGGSIFEMDTAQNGTPKFIAHSDSVIASSLTADGKGIIYGALNELWSFDVTTNQFKILGNIMVDGQQVTAGGDLTFYNGELYVAAADNTLVKVNISDPTKSSVYMTFSSTEVVIGIVSFKDCITKTFAITDGSRASILEIDWKNRTTKFLCTLPTGVYGAASRFEFLASKPDTTVIEQYTCDTNQVKSVTQVFKNSVNCDSSVTTKTIYLGSKPTITTYATCNFNDAKSDTTKFKNAKGCDSLVIKIDRKSVV